MSGDDLERLAAAPVLASFAGLHAPDWVRRQIADGLGGVVLFTRNVADAEQLEALTAELRAERPDLLIATDEEGGDVSRLEGATGRSYPGNCALGAIDDVATTEAVAREMASDLGRFGIDLDLAPVADVDARGDCAVIGTRSFGDDPELVARHTAAFIKGLQAGGVAACVKHFPGHGETAKDSHVELPVVGAGRAELEARALPPFRAAVEAGVDAVMTAHVIVTALDDRPATLSPAVVGGLLRDELGFGGLVVTDALDMAAIAAGVGSAEGAVLALAAGAGALCLGPSLDEAAVAAIRRAIVDAARAGRLSEARLVDAAVQVGAVSRDRPRLRDLDGHVRGEAALDAARRAVEAHGEISLASTPLVVELEDERSRACDPPPTTLAALLGAERLAWREADQPQVDDGGRPLVLVVRDAHRLPWQRRVVEALGPKVVVVETGLPRWRPTGVAGYLATRGSSTVNLEAAAERLIPS